MNTLALEMAFRLFLNRRRGDMGSRPVLGAVLGIALSMIPLIVVLFMSDGMIRGITDRFIETGTYHIQLRSLQSLPDEEMTETYKEIEKLPGVLRVYPEHYGMGMAFAGEAQTAVTIRGLQPGLYEDDPGFRQYLNIKDGEFSLNSGSSAMIGSETARKLGVQVGDEVKILTGKTLSTGKYIPKISRFTVKGIFSTGYQELDRLWVMISFDRSLKILQDSESRTIAGIKTETPYGDLSVLMEKMSPILHGRWGIYSWKTLNRSQQSNFETTRALLVFIMVMIVLVAVMNISSSMVMLVMENEQAIGIQKSMGLSPRTLASQYVITAALAGGIGSILGILAGCLLSFNLNGLIRCLEKGLNIILYLFHSFSGRVAASPVELLNRAYYLEEIPVDIRFSLLLVIFLATVLLSVTASFIPVRKAGGIKPLDILRKH